MSAKRVIRNGLIALGVVVVIVGGVLWYALATQSGARKVIAFALGKSTAGIEIAEVRGKLRGPLILLGIKYRSGALSAEVDSVWLDWRPWHLVKGKVLLDRLDVTGVRVVMADSVPTDTAGTAEARRERPKPPFDIVLGQTSVRDVDVKAPGDISLHADSARLTGRLEDYRIEMEGVASVPQLNDLRLRIAGRGNLEKLTLDRSTTRVLDGQLLATGVLAWWPLIGWDLRIAATGLRPSLLLQDPATLPGTLDVYGTTAGVIDTVGPVGKLVVDSLGGVLRGEPLSGRAEIGLAGTNAYDLPVLDVRWGWARIGANGVIRDTIALTYDVALGDLRQAMPVVRGAATIRGTASGPRLTPRVRAAVTGRNVAYGNTRLGRVVGRADVDLAANGVNNIDLRGSDGQAGTRRFSELVLAVRGRRLKHTIDARVTAPVDTVHVALSGGLAGTSWRGTIRDVAVRTAAAGDWRLEQPRALAVSPGSARVETLCLLADSAGGRACGEGAWHGGTTWNVLATVDGVPFQRLPFAVLNSVAGGRAAFAGTLGARLEARAVGGRLDATLRATSDTVTFRYREGADTVYRRLGLDSAVVDVRADRTGLLATLGLRIVDNAAKEVAVLGGKVTLPDYRLGDPLASEALVAQLDGTVADLSLARPLFARVDTLAGTVALTASATGTIGAPQVKGNLRMEQLVAGYNRRSMVSGGAELVVDGGVGAGDALTGRARLTPRQLVYQYQRSGDARRVTVDSGFAELVAGTDGLRGMLHIDVADADSDHVATIRSELGLPQYRRFGDPLPAQPLTLTFDVMVPDLEVFEPVLAQVDSLHGTMSVNVRATGTVGTPSFTGKLLVADATGRLPFGTMVRGGLTGDLETTVRSDSTITGTLRVTPQDLRLEYAENATVRVVRIDPGLLDVRAGPDGVHGTLGLTVARPDSGLLATFAGDLRLPDYTRVGRPLAPEPIRATLTGRADDLSFLRAFTSQVDSSAGRMTLDARLDGTLGKSHLVGGFELIDAAAHFPNLGILVHDVQLKASGDQTGSIKVDGRMRSGPGELTIQGTTPVTPTSAAPGRIEVRGTNFEAVNNGQVHAIVTTRLDVGLLADTIDVRGDVELPVGKVVLSEIPEFAVAPSKDVIFVDTLAPVSRARPINAQIRLTLGDSVTFEGFHVKAQFGGSLVATQRAGRLATANGVLTIEEGHYKAYGQDLTIKDGVIRYAGGPIDNPGLSLRVTRTADTVVAGLQIDGTLQEPRVTVFSEPAMSEGQALSYLVTGHPAGEGAGASGNLATKALTSLGLRGGDFLAKAVGEGVGLSEARIQATGDFRSAAFVAGRYLSPRLYVSYAIGLFDPVSTLRLRYVLSNQFTLQAEAGKETSADVLIKVEPKQ